MRAPRIGRVFLIFAVLFALLAGLRVLVRGNLSLLTSIPSRILQHTPLRGNNRANEFPNSLVANIHSRLEQIEVRDDEIVSHFFVGDSIREIAASIPRGRPIEWVAWYLQAAADGTGYEVADCHVTARGQGLIIAFAGSSSGREKTILTLVRADRFLSCTARMAVLVERFQFDTSGTAMAFLSFPEPLTLSLRPSADKSGLTALAADEYGKEIIIHIPMESDRKVSRDFGESMILIHYPEDRIRSIIDDAVNTVPNFAGFANLFGERALEDSRVVRIILDETSRRHGYFVDTRIPGGALVSSMAEKARVPIAAVSARIDNACSAADIEDELKHYMVIAQKRGEILVAAPASEEFILVLTRLLPLFRQNGVRLVYVSAIVDHSRHT